MTLKQACSSEWPKSARCVQRFDDSLNSAIHITYRISLRSSSMREPRDPLLKVVLVCLWGRRGVPGRTRTLCNTFFSRVYKRSRRAEGAERGGFTAYRRCTGGDVENGRRRGGRAPAPRSQQSARPAFDSVMILPQVHLRKPCYDFYFL